MTEALADMSKFYTADNSYDIQLMPVNFTYETVTIEFRARMKVNRPVAMSTRCHCLSFSRLATAGYATNLSEHQSYPIESRTP